MEHTALYRKYRPENFSELIGQDHIVSALEVALKNDKLAHAYLFSGTRGTGKTTSARIIAHAIGTKDSDIYEIDAASNRGIDNIRELRENVGTMPFESKYKVYIIDEVHMLTKEAFNALLKTLEEPPAHVIFILATTELDRVPDTIVSRCQTYTFKRPTEAILRTLIEQTAKKEKFTLEAGVSDLIAVLANGSFRDALGILQKIASISDKKITLVELARITNTPPGALVHDLVDAIARGSLAEALTVIERASSSSISFKIFLDLILRMFRRVLLVHISPALAKEEMQSLSEDEQKFIMKLAQSSSLYMNSGALLILLDAASLQRYSNIEQLPLELAVMKIIGQ